MSFPQELKDRKQWVCWRLEPDKDGGQDRKVPYNPVSGSKAQSNNSKTWTDYATAADALERYGYTGIGYMFTKDDGYFEEGTWYAMCDFITVYGKDDIRVTFHNGLEIRV